jgi:hypothetical protein
VTGGSAPCGRRRPCDARARSAPALQCPAAGQPTRRCAQGMRVWRSGGPGRSRTLTGLEAGGELGQDHIVHCQLAAQHRTKVCVRL